MISVFSLFGLLPAFIHANNTESLINSLFGVKTFIPFCSLIYSSSACNGGMGCTSTNIFSSSFSEESTIFL